MWFTMMTLIPMVLEYTLMVSEYFETKYSDFNMVSANVLVTLIQMLLEYTMVVSEYLVTKYLIMLIQNRV